MKILRALIVTTAVNLLAGHSHALAHHAFATEFEPDLTGEVEGTVTRIWWTNPHIRYAVDVKLEDGSTEQWMLQPPGNLPTYRRENWFKDTLEVGDLVRATGNLARSGVKKLYATCIYLESGRRLGHCVNPGKVSVVSADPGIDYTLPRKDYVIDISGYWSNTYKFHITVDDLEPKPMPHTPESREIYEGRQFGDDYGLRCIPVGLPRMFGSPAAMEVVNAGTHYLVVSQQFNIPRWIWMDNRSEPDANELTGMGFSLGHWEGRTLIIETTHLSPGWLDGSGYPMSGGPDTRVIERWQVAEDGLAMDRTMTIHDVLYTKPLVRTRGSQRTLIEGLIETGPCDPDSYYADMLERGLLEERLR
jgi:hypothetical protein